MSPLFPPRSVSQGTSEPASLMGPTVGTKCRRRLRLTIRPTAPISSAACSSGSSDPPCPPTRRCRPWLSSRPRATLSRARRLSRGSRVAGADAPDDARARTEAGGLIGRSCRVALAPGSRSQQTALHSEDTQRSLLVVSHFIGDVRSGGIGVPGSRGQGANRGASSGSP
jgi:hypothetical protein